MNRKYLLIGGVVSAVLIVLCITALILVWGRFKDRTELSNSHTPVQVLQYCNETQVRPCVVSFGVDVEDNMLVNMLLPNASYIDYFLKVTRDKGQDEHIYECSRVKASPTSAYCVGEKMPPGESMHIMLIATKDETLLAQGNLTIIGMVFPTLAIISPTPEIAPTEPTAMPAPTELPAETEELPDFLLPTATLISPKFPTSESTSTPPDYPPPYPYP